MEILGFTFIPNKTTTSTHLFRTVIIKSQFLCTESQILSAGMNFENQTLPYKEKMKALKLSFLSGGFQIGIFSSMSEIKCRSEVHEVHEVADNQARQKRNDMVQF